MKNKVSMWVRLKFFLKKNSYALLVSCCAIILVTALVVTAVIKSNSSNVGDIDVSENGVVIVDNEGTVAASSGDTLNLVMPVASYDNMVGFTNKSHIYNPTIKEWSTHECVDFLTTNSENVFACTDGTVESISYSTLEGTCVTIKHSDVFKSVYKSLSSEVEVAEGDTVKAGDIIGVTSDSAGANVHLGKHLSFILLENDKPIDPMTYLSDK